HCHSNGKTSISNAFAICNQSFSNIRARVELLVWRTMDGNIEVRGDQRGRGVRVGGGGGRARRRAIISDETRATVVIHVCTHVATMREAGQRVHPNRSCFSVASILRTLRRENR